MVNRIPSPDKRRYRTSGFLSKIIREGISCRVFRRLPCSGAGHLPSFWLPSQIALSTCHRCLGRKRPPVQIRAPRPLFTEFFQDIPRVTCLHEPQRDVGSLLVGGQRVVVGVACPTGVVGVGLIGFVEGLQHDRQPLSVVGSSQRDHHSCQM